MKITWKKKKIALRVIEKSLESPCSWKVELGRGEGVKKPPPLTNQAQKKTSIRYSNDEMADTRITTNLSYSWKVYLHVFTCIFLS